MSSLRVSRRAKLVIVLVVMVVIGAVTGGYWYFQQANRDATDELRDPQTGLTPAEEQKNATIVSTSAAINGSIESINSTTKEITLKQSNGAVMMLKTDDKTRIAKGVKYEKIGFDALTPGTTVSIGYWKDSNTAFEVWQP